MKGFLSAFFILITVFAFGQGGLKQDITGLFTGVVVVSSSPPNYVVQATFQSFQAYVATQIAIGDIYSVENPVASPKRVVRFRVNSVSIVSGQRVQLGLGIMDGATVLMFPTNVANLSRPPLRRVVTKDANLPFNTSAAIDNHNFLLVDSLLGVAGSVTLQIAKPNPLTTFTTNIVIDTVGVDSVWTWNSTIYRLLQTSGGASLPSGQPRQVLGYNNLSLPTAQWIGSVKLAKPRGVMVHFGDSNTNGRPGYRTAYLSEWLSSGGVFEGWQSFNMGQNGSIMSAWASAALGANNNATLSDWGPPGSNAPNIGDPGINIWAAVNGTATGLKPDIVFISLGTNDLNSPANRASIGTEANLRANLNTVVNFMLNNTEAHIVLRIPQPFVNEDFLGITQWVNDAEVLEANRRLKVVYREWESRHPRVTLYDTHRLYGEAVTNKATHAQDPLGGGPMIADALHPNDLGYRRIVQEMLQLFGLSQPKMKNVAGYPIDYWRFARWVRPFYNRSGFNTTNGVNAVFELDVAAHHAGLGQSNYWAGSGANLATLNDAERVGRSNPAGAYQELLDIGGKGDTIYVHSLVNGATAKFTNLSQAQWVGAGNYPQVQGVARNNVSIPVGPLFIYTKNATPFLPNLGSLVYTSGNAGGVTISPTGSATALNLNAGASTGTTLNISSSQQDITGINMGMYGSFGKRGFRFDMSTGQSFLVNSGEYGYYSTVSSALDDYYTRGIWVNVQKTRGAKGTNDNFATGIRAEASSSISTAGTFGYSVHAIANSGNITPVFIQGQNGGASPLLQTFAGSTRLVHNTDGKTGINIGSPTCDLDVLGDIRTRSALRFGANNLQILEGAGDPNGSVTASVGSIYMRNNLAGSIFYIKETGSGNTGWLLQQAVKTTNTTVSASYTINEADLIPISELFVTAKCLTGATAITDVILPQPSTALQGKRVTIYPWDESSTQYCAVYTTVGRMHYSADNLAAPSPKTFLDLTTSASNAGNGKSVTFVCVNVDGTLYWVPENRQ